MLPTESRNDRKLGCRTAKSMKAYTAQINPQPPFYTTLLPASQPTCRATSSITAKPLASSRRNFPRVALSEAYLWTRSSLESQQLSALYRQMYAQGVRRTISSDMELPGLSNGTGSGRRQDRAGSAER
jgi:hypothetical protein